MFTEEDVYAGYECACVRVCVCVFAFGEPLNLPVQVGHASHWISASQSGHVWVCVCLLA